MNISGDSPSDMNLKHKYQFIYAWIKNRRNQKNF